MTLKPRYVYGDRWALYDARPLSENSFYVFDGVEETGDEEYYLEGRPVILKVIKYGPGLKRDDIVLRRKAFARQLQILALEHFMLPEPLDFCAIPNDHTPEIAGTDLAADEPLLVYAYSPGRTLREWVQEDTKARCPAQPLPPLEALQIVRKIADFLAYLHKEGYSHIAINPDHFLYHHRSLRVLGLGKIAPIDPQTGYARPCESPALPSEERPYTLPEALATGRFGLGNEWRGLAFLLIFLVSGECPSRVIRKPGDEWSLDRLEDLPLCNEVKALLQEGLTAADQPFSRTVEQDYQERLATAHAAQRQAAEAESIRACEIGIFVDFANMWRAFRSQRGGRAQQTVLDFDAIATHCARFGPVYKFAAVPAFYTDGRPAQALIELERAGWDVRRVQAPEDETEGGSTLHGGMDEKDDSALVQAASRFLTLAHPRQIVVVSNDSDYAQLVERARFQGVEVDVIHGHDPASSRRVVSAQYLRQLQECGAKVHSIYTFPFVFAEETWDFFAQHGLRGLLFKARSTQNRAFLWALAREAGRDGVHRLFERADAEPDGSAYGLVRAMEHYDADYYSFCARVLLRSNDLKAEVESLRRHRKILEKFNPRNLDLLEQVYALAVRNSKRARRLADAAPLVEANWDVLAGRLDEEPLVRLFTGKRAVDPQLHRVIAEDPSRYLKLSKRFHNSQKQLTWTLTEFGAEALLVVERYGERVFPILRRYEEAAFERLSSSRAQMTLDALGDSTTRPMVEEWYRRHNDLDLLDLLASEPSLSDLVRRAGIGAAEVYRDERSLERVQQIVRLSTVAIRPVEEGYQVWRALRERGLDIEGVINSLGSARRHSSRPFRKRLPFDEFVELVPLIYQADQEGVLSTLLTSYAQVGRAVLWAYGQLGMAVLLLIERYRDLLVAQPTADARARVLIGLTRAAALGAETDLADLIDQMGLPALDAFERYGVDLFSVVQATEPAVVHVLAIYHEPVIFSDLQRYGRAAYDLVRAYRDAARDALLRLEQTDLASLLSDPQALAFVEAWYTAHSDLRALDLMVAEPNLLLWASGFGRLVSRSTDPLEVAQHGVDVLRLYSVDRDLARLDATMRLATGAGFLLREAHGLLRAADVPTAVASEIIMQNATRIMALSTIDARTELVQAIYCARGDGVEADLISAYDQVGMAAVRAYEQFGRLVFTLVHDISVDTLGLLLRFPRAFQSLLRYGALAYRFVREFEQPAVDKLAELEHYDLTNALSDTAWPVLLACHQSHHNLDVVNDLVSNWELMPYIQRAGLKAVLVWRALLKAQGEQAAAWLAQHAEMLLNPAHDYTCLVPLVGQVEPRLLENVVARYYDELLQYPGPAERIRFCKLFANRLDLVRDGERYVGLCTTVNRMALLPLAEATGAPLLDLLEMLKPQARLEAVGFMQRLAPRVVPAYVNDMLKWAQFFAGWPDTSQVKLIRACQYQPVASIVSAWSDYGEAALGEIIKHRKIRWLFKVTHLKRR